jgi:Protein of unknown function (DUF1553)
MSTDWSDKILESFLEEAVTGRRPPDLLASITSAWQQECAEQGPRPAATEATGELKVSPVAVPKAASKAVTKPSKPRVSYAWQVLLVVAASGLLIAGVVQWRTFFMPTENSIATVKGSKVEPTTPPQLAPQVASTNPTKAPKKGKNSFNGEKLGTENVPFASNEPVKPSEKEPIANSIAKDNRLSQQQIVELIDTQFGTLWQRLNVTPESKLDASQLGQLLAKTLTGQELPSTVHAELAEEKSGERRERAIAQVINEATDSQAFARLWAKDIVFDWLDGGNVPVNSPSVQELEQFVAGEIAGGRPWNEVVARAVSDDVLVAAFADGGNHRLAAHLSGAFMDSSLACVRCHEPKGQQGVATSQEQYWSLVAMLMGLDVRNDKATKTRTAIDKQAEVFAQNKKPSLFFDRPDGTLMAAKFVLPDGQPWNSITGAKTPRAALATWIGDSSQSDQAIVNQVWKQALGRPLVASNALVDDVGLTERTELQHLLAQQFRAHGRNLKQLVGWVVRSDVFARNSIAVDKTRWLQASDNEIENWHLSEMTFAARTSLGKQTAQGGLENSLAAAIQWNQAKTVSGASVLAQPSLDPKSKPKASITSDVVMPSPGYVIHRGRLSQDQQSYVAGLAASEKLTWEQKVEHIVLLSPTLIASGGVKRMSDELLKSLGDPKAALTELMWAVQNADAS